MTCTVTRSRGDVGAVNVTWEVLYAGSSTQAGVEFDIGGGYLEFQPGDRSQVRPAYHHMLERSRSLLIFDYIVRGSHTSPVVALIGK